MQRPAARPERQPAELEPDGEAETAGHDRKPDGEVDRHIADEPDEVVAVEGEARVIERGDGMEDAVVGGADRKSTRLNSSHANISYAVFCLKKKKHN